MKNACNSFIYHHQNWGDLSMANDWWIRYVGGLCCCLSGFMIWEVTCV